MYNPNMSTKHNRSSLRAMLNRSIRLAYEAIELADDGKTYVRRGQPVPEGVHITVGPGGGRWYPSDRGIGREQGGTPDEPRGSFTGWEPFSSGAYGTLRVSADKSTVVKLDKGREDGKPGLGPIEADLAQMMGELGHGPEVISSGPDHIEMDRFPGKTLWASYGRGEDEPLMNAAQSTALSNALKDLHKRGYFHGDMHAQQVLVQGDGVALVDYGLSGKFQDDPRKMVQDLNKIHRLADFENPELDGNPHVQLIRETRSRYADAKRNPGKEAEVAKFYYNEVQKI